MQVVDYQAPILGDFKLHGLFQHPANPVGVRRLARASNGSTTAWLMFTFQTGQMIFRQIFRQINWCLGAF
jgi:hypothetical protein